MFKRITQAWSKLNAFKPNVILFIGITFLILAVIFRYWNHAHQNVIASDGKGYYAYLPAILIFHDFNFEFYFNGLLNIDPEYTSSFLYFLDGHYVVKYPAGVAFLMLPFFILACFLSFVTEGVVDGYSFWFQIMTSIAALTYTTLGLYWIKKLLESYNVKNNAIIWILLMLAFGTNLTFYSIYDASMSHAYSFSMVALLLLHTRRYFLNQNKSSLFICAFAIGSILLIRSLNFLVLIGLPIMAADKNQLYSAFRSLFNKPLRLVLTIIIISAVISIQPLIWYLETGKFYVWTYITEWFDFSHPKILKVLFSYRKGWFVYTPAMILLIPGLFIMFRQKKLREALFTIAVFASATYFISSWWCWYFGGSFGQRSYIDYYPFAVLPISLLFTENFRYNLLLKSFILVCVILNLIQSFQYKNNILHYDAMTKEKYWKVFLRVSDNYKWVIFKNPNDETDKDIQNDIIVKCFNEFDYPIPQWQPFTNIDIADDALSGNKVLSLSELKETVRYELKDEALKSGNPLKIRFKAWFKGDPLKLNWKLIQMSNQDTVNAVNPGNNLKATNQIVDDWKQYSFDIELTQKNSFDRVVLEFQKSNDKIHMDDAMIYIYK